MINADELRKQLTASEAYNRFMERRVHLLEMEVQMLQSATSMAAAVAAVQQDGGRPSPPMGGTPQNNNNNNNNKSVREAKDMTAAQILEELMRLRVDHKTVQSELKATKKELSMTKANLQHFSSKEQQQRQRASQLSEEVRQLRSLLPPHLFDGSGGTLGLSADGTSSARGSSYLSIGGDWAKRGSSTGTTDSSADGNAAGGGGEGSSVAGDNHHHQALIKKGATLAAESQSALKKLVTDVAAAAEAMLNLPANGAANTISVDALPSTLSVDLTETTNVADRMKQWRRLSARLHTVLKFSKREWSEPEPSTVSSSSTNSKGPASNNKKVDRTQAQLEALLGLVDRHVDHLKELVLELPKGLAQYLTRCRGGIGIIVDGQRANTPSAVAGLKASAVQLAAELKRYREEFASSLRAVQQQTATLCSVLMSGVDAAVGVNMYRGLPHALRFVTALESQIAVLMNFDKALEVDVLKDMVLVKPSPSTSSSLSNPLGSPAGSSLDENNTAPASPQPWYVQGLDLEKEITRMALLDPKTDRIEKLDIVAIKRLFPDSLSMAASIAAGGGMNTTVAEAVVTLESIKTSATQLLKLFRGDATLLLNSTTAAAHEDTVVHRGIQCNLQQQKMQMTENELHIARLANIRSNWFEAAVSHSSAAASPPNASGSSSPYGMVRESGSPSGDGSSPSGTANTTGGGNVTPRGGGKNILKSPRGRPSAADVERLVEQYRHQYTANGLSIPQNFSPVRSKVQRYNTEHDGFLYHFGRKVISLHVTGGGAQLAVHIGGGYITFEEFCFKYGPGEVMMAERGVTGASGAAASNGDHQSISAKQVRIAASPEQQQQQPHAVFIDADEVLDRAGGQKASVPKLRASLAAALK